MYDGQLARLVTLLHELLMAKMSAVNKLLVAAATAALFVLNIVLTCKPFRRRCGKDVAAEQQSLLEPRLSNTSSAAKDEVDRSAAGTFQQGAALLGSLPLEPDHDLGDVATAILESAPVPPALGILDGALSAEQIAVAVGAPINIPAAGKAPVQAGPAASIDEPYLQSLLDQELGPPKFPVSKKAPLSDQSQEHLRALIDQEFGPPKFSVPKVDSSNDDVATAAVLDDVPSGDSKPAADAEPVPPATAGPVRSTSSSGLNGNGTPPAGGSSRSHAKRPSTDFDAPHIALEVISGPAAGKAFSTSDTVRKLHIGRNADRTFMLEDPEVSGQHAVVSFDVQEQAWTLMDTGSLNGTILNGRVVSTEYRMSGEAAFLADQDLVEFGSSSLVRVTCTPSSSKRLHTGRTSHSGEPSATAVAAAPLPPRPSIDGPPACGSDGLGPARQAVPPLLAHARFACVCAEMAVHQRLGAEHRRMSQGCEDVALWEAPLRGFPQASLFAIFDGHNGSKAAGLAKQLLPQLLQDHLAAGRHRTVLGEGRREQAVQQALLKRVFLDTDAKIALDEGCTATVLLLERGEGDHLHLQTANVGDSSAVLVLASGEWRKLTEDHRIASSASERRRLETRGHTVRTRLYGLNISRMLGDRFLKDEDLGFLAEPHVSVLATIPARERAFLLLASDGLWDVLPEAKAAALVSTVAAAGAASATGIADTLLAQAIGLRSKDDITVMVLDLNNLQPVAPEPSDALDSS